MKHCNLIPLLSGGLEHHFVTSKYCAEDCFSSDFSYCWSLLHTELEVARLSTDGNLEDLKFPQNLGHGSAIQLSANTLKQNGRNGRSKTSGHAGLPNQSCFRHCL